jgi:hypothetical protein
VIDLGDANRARDLAHGGAFIPGLTLPELAECDLVMQHNGRELALAARVVMVGANGVGLEVVGFNAGIRECIAELARSSGLAAATPAPTPIRRAISSPAMPVQPPMQREPTPPPGPVIKRPSQPLPVQRPSQPIPAQRPPERYELETEPVPALAADHHHHRDDLPELPELSTQPRVLLDHSAHDHELPELSTQPRVHLAFEPEPDPEPTQQVEAEALELGDPVAAALLPQLPMETGLQSFELDTSEPDVLDLAGATPAIVAPWEVDHSEPLATEDEVAAAVAGDVDVDVDDDDAEADADIGDKTGETPLGDLPPDDDTETEEEAKATRSIPKNVAERVRGLNLAQQIKLAHTGETAERILLERFYGKHVWEALLRNPRITGPEVARISRMGQLPRPLIEIIVGNGAWLQIPEVRRALLSNPRLVTDQIQRIMYLLPKHELKLACVNSAYPHGVRDCARRMTKQMKK